MFWQILGSITLLTWCTTVTQFGNPTPSMPIITLKKVIWFKRQNNNRINSLVDVNIRLPCCVDRFDKWYSNDECYVTVSGEQRLSLSSVHHSFITQIFLFCVFLYVCGQKNEPACVCLSTPASPQGENFSLLCHTHAGQLPHCPCRGGANVFRILCL